MLYVNVGNFELFFYIRLLTHTYIHIAHTFIRMYRYTHIYEGYHGGHVEGRSKDNLLELVLSLYYMVPGSNSGGSRLGSKHP